MTQDTEGGDNSTAPRVRVATGTTWTRGDARIIETRLDPDSGSRDYILYVGYERFPMVDDLSKAQRIAGERAGDAGPWTIAPPRPVVTDEP